MDKKDEGLTIKQQQETIDESSIHPVLEDDILSSSRTPQVDVSNNLAFTKRIFNRMVSIKSDPSFTIAMAGLVVAMIGLVASLLAVAYPTGFRGFLTSVIPGEKYSGELAADKASNVGVDYNYLDNLLREKKYKEANDETNLIILDKILEKRTNDNMTREDIEKISEKRSVSRDLLTINRLWNLHTNNTYGFNIQNCIFTQVRNSSSDDWIDKFLKEIGRIREGQSLEYDKMEFSENRVKGYLPRLLYRSDPNDDMKILSAFLSAKENKCPNVPNK
jgi:GUN4-like